MKKVVAVIFGGYSPEYDVSLKSSYSIINAIDRDKYNVVLIGITRQGSWYKYSGDVDDIPSDGWHTKPEFLERAIISPERGGQLLEIGDDGKLLEIVVDVVFPVLHGRYGEDGTIQGLCELAGIPIVGSGAAASALCMDKDRAHKLVSLAGVRVPNSVCFEQVPTDDELCVAIEDFNLPVFVKPVKAGSSFGVSKVESLDRLFEAVRIAFSFDDAVLIEENIEGHEMGCAVFGNTSLTVGRVDEIELSDGFFTYEEKYSTGTSTIHMPARISEDVERKLQETAKVIYKILGCRGYCRIDVFLTKTGQIVFNEANTIPGFTSKSRFPKMIEGVGIAFPELVETLIELSLSN